ncbi:alpha/beta hydrolase [Candidatus Jorgensenbacteria bacterium]|nr:alpha/beta hydrolase [Candidatus Jorgensenbacteria bacterium]
MRKAVIIHCWDGYPTYCWYPKVKSELEAFDFTVEVPAMPETNSPALSRWLPTLTEAVGSPNENLYLVGHSVGCITIIRYLESLKDDQNVGGVVFVAGFTDDLGYKELSNFFETSINFPKIKTRSKSFVAIHSDNDPYVSLKHGEIFKTELGAELIIKHAMQHFSGPRDDEKSCTSLPDVTEAILRMSKSR